ncbi:MAG TPA: DUF2066 domain-containing protein [Gammaproteobacteria bacterium]|nr:DUF2066 domain-containing protein [Gammaproteobacteria bacterium]
MRTQLPRGPRGLLRRAIAAALLAGVLTSGTAVAARFPNLYEATVTPDPAASDPQASAEALALGRVLVRVTGNRQAALDPQLQALVSNPQIVNSRAVLQQGQRRIGFSPRAVDDALTALKWPVWGAERPLTLLWVAVDDGLGGRALLSENDFPSEAGPAMTEQLRAIRAELGTAADERGLPIALPLLDAEDLAAVTFSDVMGGFDDRVAEASTRYRADAILIGKIRPDVTGTEVQWLLVRGGERRPLEGIGVRDGLDAVADLYAADLSVVGGTATTLISVLDVSSAADYGRVMSYLESLSVLQSVDVDSLDRGVLSLRINARGGAQVLERVLALGGVLSPATSGAAQSSPAAQSGPALAFKINRGAAR